MIEKTEDKYPMHGVVKVHPKAGNIVGKECPFCTKDNAKNMVKNSDCTTMKLVYDNDHGWRLYTSIKDFVASNCSDDDIYHHSFSDTIKFCPMCSRKLV